MIPGIRKAMLGKLNWLEPSDLDDIAQKIGERCDKITAFLKWIIKVL